MIQKYFSMINRKKDIPSINLESYINIYTLLKGDVATPEENRAFGLKQIAWKDYPFIQLSLWMKLHHHRLQLPSLAEVLHKYLYGVTLTLAIIACVVGLVSGWGLLSYNGHEPVNVIYFMAMVIFFPLFTMTLTIISMFRASNTQSVLVHISPAFWMEKLISFLPHSVKINMDEVKMNPLLMHWMVIKRSQIIALCFSFGLLFGLLSMVSTKDIAFAWSTTLDIRTINFHDFLYHLSFAWRDILPSAVPSLSLIEESQYFRLGDNLSDKMIANAAQLGEWWKFLLMATLFYAIIVRFFLLLVSILGFNRALKKSLLTLEGVGTLLREMNEPMLTTQSPHGEVAFVPSTDSYKNIVYECAPSYDMIQGWSLSQDSLREIGDSLGIFSPKIFEVGGANTFAEDEAIVAKSKGDVLLIVKGWEPPTDDFADYLADLSKVVEKVIILPIGIVEDAYRLSSSAIDVWDKKLLLIHKENVWLKR